MKTHTKQTNVYLGGGFIFFKFSPRTLGKGSKLTFAYFSNGLVQPPPTRCLSNGSKAEGAKFDGILDEIEDSGVSETYE